MLRLVLSNFPQIGVGEFVLKLFVVPTLTCLAVLLPVVFVWRAIAPRFGRRWLHSRLRARYLTMSRGKLCFVIAFTGNLMVVLMWLPVLQVPPGSGIKPMAHVFFSLVINVITGMMCQRVVRDERRPEGSRTLITAAFVLCLTPFIAGIFLMHMIAAIRNLEFGYWYPSS